MLKRVFKGLVWWLLVKDVWYRCKMYHANQGRAPDYALVKAWRKEDYDAFMKNPHWWDRVAFKEVALMAIVILILVGMMVFMVLHDTYTPTGNLEQLDYVLEKYKVITQ